MRVLLMLDGLEPVPQYVLWLDEQSSARLDLAFPELKVAIEYDGDWRDGQLWALNRDRERLNRIHALGWYVIFVTAPLLRDRRKLLATVRQALAR
jgi:very-short-patch-repair endonuclease